MATASPHARQHHHPAAEAGLWLVWITARITGLAALTRAVHTRLAAVPWGYLAGIAIAWTGRHTYRALHGARNLTHRATLSVQLAAADLLTGPLPALIETTTTRLRARVLWLAVVVATALNALHLALR